MTGTGATARRRRATAPLAAVVVAALLATTACSAGEEAEPATTQAAEVVTPKSAPPQPAAPEPEPQPEPVVWPLTGVRVDGKLPRRPALAVKIENSPQSRPHTGLHAADIVWEQVVEGGVSRFVAIYHSKTPDTIGPIRSVRPMDAATVAPLKGLLAYSGGQGPFIDRVGNAGVQSIIMDRGAPGFWRSNDRYAPHNVYGSPRTFWKQAFRSRAVHPPAQFAYAAKRGEGTAAQVGGRAKVADVRLSSYQRTVWDWWPKSRYYARGDGSTPSVSSGQRITARNVLLLSMSVRNTNYRDPSGAPVPETRMVDRGRGVLLGDGKSVRVQWSKTGVRKRLVITRLNGKPVELEPGNTWIELVPRGTGTWRIR